MDAAEQASPEAPVRLGPSALSLCAMNLAGVVFYEPIDDVPDWFSVIFFMAAYALLAGISFIVIWFFWRRHNWARWLVLATSVLSLANLMLLPSVNPAAQVLIIIEALFGAWLLYWLDIPRVASLFKRPAA